MKKKRQVDSKRFYDRKEKSLYYLEKIVLPKPHMVRMKKGQCKTGTRVNRGEPAAQRRSRLLLGGGEGRALHLL